MSITNAIEIRPHHTMCLAFFEGKGYSDKFSAHMKEMLDQFLKNPVVVPVLRTDGICSCCPNNINGECTSPDKVLRYDRELLEITGIEAESSIRFRTFTGIVQQKVISTGLREKICGDCQWNSICSAKKSLWEDAAASDVQPMRNRKQSDTPDLSL